MHLPQLETLNEHCHFWCTHHISVLSMLASTDLYLELSTAGLKRTYLVSPVDLTCPSMSDNCSYVPFEDNSKLSICIIIASDIINTLFDDTIKCF